MPKFIGFMVNTQIPRDARDDIGEIIEGLPRFDESVKSGKNDGFGKCSRSRLANPEE
jgi:hypothetical protein